MGYTPLDWTGTSLSALNFNHAETQYNEMKSLSDSHNHDTLFYNKTQADTRYFYSGHMGQGSGFDADWLDGIDGTDLIGIGLQCGIILAWKGSIETIPAGWSLCDGSTQNGYPTPDMRNRFVIGAGGTYSPGINGGTTTFTPAVGTVTVSNHTLTLTELPAHTHTWTDRSVYFGVYSGGSSALNTKTYWQHETSSTGGGQPHNHTGNSGNVTSGAVDSKPKYFALAFIMKTA